MAVDSKKYDLETGAPSTVIKSGPGLNPRIAKYMAKSSTGQECGCLDTTIEKGRSL